MAEREFTVVKVAAPGDAPGHSRRAYRIDCAECGERDEWIINGRPPIAAKQAWEAKGWNVGNRPRVDMCPSCMAALRPARRQPTTILKEFNQMASVTAPVPVKADPPRTMTREDRRIIFEKLNEVYLDEDRGYAPGNSDKTVAIGLGCPRAWVAQIRDENFGAARDNEDVRDLLAKIEALREIIAKASVEFEALSRRLTEAKADLDVLQRTAATIAKATV